MLDRLWSPPAVPEMENNMAVDTRLKKRNAQENQKTVKVEKKKLFSPQEVQTSSDDRKGETNVTTMLSIESIKTKCQLKSLTTYTDEINGLTNLLQLPSVTL